MNVTDPRKQQREPRLFGPSQPMRAALVPPLSAARWLLVLIVAAGIYFFHGFLVPVLAALVIAFASWPLYRRLLTAVDGNRTIGATLAHPVHHRLPGRADRLCRRPMPSTRSATGSAGRSRPTVTARRRRCGFRNLPVVGEWLNEQWTPLSRPSRRDRRTDPAGQRRQYRQHLSRRARRRRQRLQPPADAAVHADRAVLHLSRRRDLRRPARSPGRAHPADALGAHFARGARDDQLRRSRA